MNLSGNAGSVRRSMRELYLDDAVNRADCNTGSFVMEADAVNAHVFIDDIQTVAGRNCGNGTFRLTCTAIGAFISNTMCHRSIDLS